MITKIKRNNKGATYTVLTEESLIDEIRGCGLNDSIATFRTVMTINGPGDAKAVAQNCGIAEVCFAALWKKTNGNLEQKEYNSLVPLEISNLPSPSEAYRLRDEAARIPYTRIAYVGATGRDVAIVCAINTDNVIGEITADRQKALHTAAYKMLHYLYSSQLQLSVDNIEPRLDNTCLLSADDGIHYNPNSEPYIVSSDNVNVPIYRNAKIGEVETLSDDSVVSLHTVFEWCLSSAMEEARSFAGEYGIEDEESINMHCLSLLAENCNDANLPMDFGIRNTSWKRCFRKDVNYITKVFENAYEAKASKDIPYGKVNKNALMAYKTEAFLKMHYEMRRNIMTGVVQYRKKDGYDYDFHDLTDEALNTMTNRAVKAGIGSWDKDMRRIINSEDVKIYDPIEDFIFSLPKWDGKDYVSDFINRIPTDSPVIRHWLCVWLLSMVAHWLGRDLKHGNALVPLLIGEQGCGKSTFCGMILPPELSDYYNDKVNFKNETDINLGLSSFALINIDEFDSVKKSQQPVLKYLLSKSTVRMRPPFGKAFVNRRRFASFIGTTNHTHPLTDPTGSRRFVCIQIPQGSIIDTTTPVNHRQLYAQLYHEIFSGACYWLNEEETKLLMQHNDKFRNITDLAELIDLVFVKPVNEGKGEYLSTYKIVDVMTKYYPLFNRTSKINLEVGKVLRGKGYAHKHTNTGTAYLVQEINKS